MNLVNGSNGIATRPSQATRALTYLKKIGYQLYADKSQRTYILLNNDIYPIFSNKLRFKLTGIFYEKENISTNHANLGDAELTLHGVALEYGETSTQDLLDVMEANTAIEKELLNSEGGQKSMGTWLAELAINAGAELFHDQTEEPHIVATVEGKREILRTKSQRCKQWLSKLAYDAEGMAPSTEPINSAINLLSAKAIFEGERHDLSLRVAWYQGSLYYDLGEGRGVKITAEEWQIVEQLPIIFRRFGHQSPQAEPITGGDFLQMLKFLSPTNTYEEAMLLAVTILSYFVPGSPRTALSIAGPQGSGKSVLALLIKRLVDPSSAMSIKRIPKLDDLVLMLEAVWLLNFDNLSGINGETSDLLAAAITGDADLRRMLYTDREFIITEFMRPMILNGITHAPQRADLLDRTVLITLERIPANKRRAQEELLEEFRQALPGILGSAFDIISRAIRIKPDVKLAAKPRMADFAEWGWAIAEAMGWGGASFLATYEKNISKQHEEAVSALVVAQVVMTFMDGQDEWKGQPTKLKQVLDEYANNQGIDTKDTKSGWPKDAARLSKELKRLAETLAGVGIEFSSFQEKKNAS